MARRKATDGGGLMDIAGIGAGEEAGEKDRQFISALARGLEVLRAFDPDDPMLGNQEIAQRTGLPKPTVSRIAYTLTRLGYLKYNPKLEKYQLGSAVLAFGQAYMASMAVREIARPHMQELAEATRTTVALGDRDRLSMVYIELQRGVSHVILHQDIGSRLPIAETSMGWSWLARAPEPLRTQVMDAIKTSKGKDWPATKTSIETAEREIAQHGYCLGMGTWLPDINGAGAPFVSPDGRTVLAFNIGGPSFVLSEERLHEEVGPRLASMVHAVEADYRRRGFF
ncbi:IclR family transcriptional regulator [Kaustia mangrovi]|nr:IclR family transcriptional regulator [Kaustia mangrovi]